MKNFLTVHNLISAINEHCARNSVDHESMVAALMMLLLSDMRAFGVEEHNLADDDAVVLLNVRKLE